MRKREREREGTHPLPGLDRELAVSGALVLTSRLSGFLFRFAEREERRKKKNNTSVRE